MKIQLPERDWQIISNYLDGQLTTAERQVLEQRLVSNPDLSAACEEMRRLRLMLRSLPQRKAPHNFTLTRAMAAEARRGWNWFMALRVSSTLTAVLAVVLLVFQFLPVLSPSTSQQAAPAVAPLAAAPLSSSLQVENTAGETSPTPQIFQWGYAFGRGGGGGGGGGDGSEGVAPPLAAIQAAPAAPAAEPPSALEGNAPLSKAAPQPTEQAVAQPTEQAALPPAEQLAPPLAVQATPAPTEQATPQPTEQTVPQPTEQVAVPAQMDQAHEPAPLAAGSSPILGLPSPREAGQMIVPAPQAAETFSLPPTVSSLPAEQPAPRWWIPAVVLALLALGCGLAAYRMRR